MNSYAVVDPRTGTTLREYPALADAELTAVLDRVAATYRSWGRTSQVEERAGLLRRAGQLHLENRDELAAVISREMGKPVAQARGEVEFTAAIYAYYADHARTLLADEPLAVEMGPGTAVLRRSSLGVLLGVMPWNYPCYQVARFAAPNLMIGNTILLKPAPQCPDSAAAISALLVEAGFPAGAFESVHATHAQVERVIADPRVVGVSLTGSDRAGSLVAEAAGRHLKKVVLELGGSDPFIVLSTDDLDATVSAALAARFYENAGQICTGAKRFIVIDDLHDAFVSRMTAALARLAPEDPAREETVLGPLSSEAAAERLEGQVLRVVEAGATMLLGGPREGAFFPPTVLTDIGPDNEAAREELFGPVALVYRAGSEDDAVRLANDTPYGLGSYLFTTDPVQAERVADRIEAGMVNINIVGGDEPGLPFGGVKRSGFGRELGRLGVEEFVNRKLIRIGPGGEPSGRNEPAAGVTPVR
ncbi:NAD-dependent succinate-semialdehyde dehydrogenase [Streptomyces sp. NPDC048282]|uniref:NAD-dependent succinate-semialdehyde dehydrogenase n=1 Tax=Streptomyces sp. NPDC048282 TaxID=3365528 RepID=UPI0037130188